MIAHLEGLRVHPSPGVVGQVDNDAVARCTHVGLTDALSRQIDIRLSLLELALDRSHLGLVGPPVQLDRRLLDAQLRFGGGEIDFARFALQHTHNRLLGRFEFRAVHVVPCAGQVEFILLGSHARLSQRLRQRRFGLIQHRRLLVELAFGSARVEPDHDVARLDMAPRFSQPDDFKSEYSWSR